MVNPVLTSYSQSFPVAVEKAFDDLLPEPLPDLFNRRYGPIPRIKSVEGQVGVWGQVGQTRTIRLADGGSMREELTLLDRPRAFGYTISDVTGPLKPLVSHVQGLWSFEPDGTGTRITWQWTIQPKSALAAPIMPIFTRLWRGYAKRSFEQIDKLLLRG
jgi:hypothetical protein